MWADRASRFVYFISPYFAWIYKIFLWILSVVFSPFIVPIALVGGLIGAGIYDVYQDRPADKRELAVALQDRCVANELVTYKRVIAKQDISRLTRGCKRSRTGQKMTWALMNTQKMLSASSFAVTSRIQQSWSS